MLLPSLECLSGNGALERVVGPVDVFPAPTARMGSLVRSLGCSPLSERPKHIIRRV